MKQRNESAPKREATRNRRITNGTLHDASSRLNVETSPRNNNTSSKRDEYNLKQDLERAANSPRTESDIDESVSKYGPENPDLNGAPKDINDHGDMWETPSKIFNNNLKPDFTPNTFESRMKRKSDLASTSGEEEDAAPPKKENNSFLR